MDLLTSEQRDHLDRAADMDAFEFTAAHTVVLLATIGSGRTGRYASWKQKHEQEHGELLGHGILLSVAGEPDRVEIAADALYSPSAKP